MSIIIKHITVMETFILLLVLLGIASIGGALLVYALQPKSQTTVEVKLIKRVQPDEDIEQPLND